MSYRLVPQRDLINIYLKQFPNANTRFSYGNDLRTFSRVVLKREWITPSHIRRITLDQLVDYVLHLSKNHTFTTMTRRLSTLERFFDWAAKQGYIEESPSRQLREAFRVWLKKLSP